MPRHPPCTLSSLTTFIDRRLKTHCLELEPYGAGTRAGSGVRKHPHPPRLSSRRIRTSRSIHKRASLRETIHSSSKERIDRNRTRQKGARRITDRRKDHHTPPGEGRLSIVKGPVTQVFLHFLNMLCPVPTVEVTRTISSKQGSRKPCFS